MSPSQQIVDTLVRVGFNPEEIVVRSDGRVFVGGDMQVSLAAAEEMALADLDDSEHGDQFRQYRTTNLVAGNVGVICIDGSALSGSLSTALNNSIFNYNAENLQFNFRRTTGSNVGCEAEITANAIGGSGGSSGFPAGGLPFATINIGTGIATTAQATHVITHEIGHAIGLRHSDFYNRSISCGGAAINEGGAGVGAIHIPGTPTTAVWNGSFMNACYNAGSDGSFTGSDIVAFDALYGVFEGRFGGARASFSGTLNFANLDASGHFLLRNADVTGDGRADLVSTHTNGNAYVWPGRADGSYASAKASFNGTLNMANLDGWGHSMLNPADVTGDGRADLISSHTNGSVYVWPGRADGSFGAAVSSFAGTMNMANLDGWGHYLIGAADVTGDGHADLVSAHTNGNAYVWPGRAAGNFASAASTFSGTLNIANLDDTGHYIVDVADVTGDGRADLVSAHTNGNAYVWPGRSDAHFAGATASFGGTLNLANADGSGHLVLNAADVTGDGRADLVSAHTNGNAYVWPGSANGAFGPAVSSFRGTLNMANLDGWGHYMLGAADVTGDGQADLLSAHTNGNAYVWPAM